jgi:hypothetical protein
MYKNITPPTGGKSPFRAASSPSGPPVIPFIRGDGTGPDIWAASERVLDAAVQKAYGGKRKIAWFEVFAGETAKNKFDDWLPDDTIEAFRELPCRHQRAIDHTRRWRHPFAECGASAIARSLRLPPPGPVFPGRAKPREAPGESGHGHLPREHRRHLRRH